MPYCLLNITSVPMLAVWPLEDALPSLGPKPSVWAPLRMAHKMIPLISAPDPCPLASLPAPSAVSIMHQVSRTVDSITLSWSQPDQPNGVILDYELQYYEKVFLSPQSPTEILCQPQPGILWSHRICWCCRERISSGLRLPLSDLSVLGD